MEYQENNFNDDNGHFNYNDNDYRGYTPESPFATASMICGILSIPLCFCYGVIGILCGIAALILFFIYKNRTPGKISSRALAGIICGCIGLVLSIIWLCWTIFVLTHYEGILNWIKTMEANGYGR